MTARAEDIDDDRRMAAGPESYDPRHVTAQLAGAGSRFLCSDSSAYMTELDIGTGAGRTYGYRRPA
jgi:hypothetical protein